MLKKIIYLLIFCLGLNVSMSAFAQSKLMVPFKAPFGFFGDKKESKVEQKNDVNMTVEENKTEIKKQIISKKVHDPKNIVGITFAENTVNKAEFYIEEEDFESAELAINSINEWIFDATEFHTDLYKTLKKLDNSEVQANVERDLAIKFAVLRDKTLFLESKVLLKKGNKRHAVENLVEVVRSQPATSLGFQAYEMLQDLGFTYKIEYEMINN